jgi:transcriptional regulator with XRE-family HTH domain
MSPNRSRTRAPADGDVIRELRLDQELTLPKAAVLVGCHFKTLEKIERGKVGASEIMIRKIARAYGVTPDEIRRQDVAA